MSKIRVLIYRHDIHSLKTKTVSFPDQEKILKEAVFNAVSIKPILKTLEWNIVHAQNTLKWETFAKQSRNFLANSRKIETTKYLISQHSRNLIPAKMFNSSVTKVFSREKNCFSSRANYKICFY